MPLFWWQGLICFLFCSILAIFLFNDFAFDWHSSLSCLKYWNSPEITRWTSDWMTLCKNELCCFPVSCDMSDFKRTASADMFISNALLLKKTRCKTAILTLFQFANINNLRFWSFAILMARLHKLSCLWCWFKQSKSCQLSPHCLPPSATAPENHQRKATIIVTIEKKQKKNKNKTKNKQKSTSQSQS